jgi:hypothetical protein
LSGGELDRYEPWSGPSDHAPKLVVQPGDVEKPGVPASDGHLAVPRQFVHASEHAPVGGLREFHVVDDKMAEGV